MEEEVKDLLITLPKDIDWKEYKTELYKAEYEGEDINFKVSSLPKGLTPGKSKICVTHQGIVRGYMILKELCEKSFECTTEGTAWSGKFIVRSGKFFSVLPLKVKGFQGFRYFNYNDSKE